MKIRPLQDRIIVKRLEEETKTKGGIIIPDTAKEKPIEGKVIAVGKGKVADDGKQGFFGSLCKTDSSCNISVNSGEASLAKDRSSER